MSEIVRVGNGNRDIEKVMTNELETAEENGVLLIDTQDQYEGIDEKLGKYFTTIFHRNGNCMNIIFYFYAQMFC